MDVRELEPGEVLPDLIDTIEFPNEWPDIKRRHRGFDVPTRDRVVTLKPGAQRCGASGLERGDCRQDKLPGSAYCYYHDKLERGLCSPSVPTPQDLAMGDHRDGMALYPTWPLPPGGYTTLTDQARRLAVA